LVLSALAAQASAAARSVDLTVTEGASRALRKIVGKKVSARELSALGGALDGAEVRVKMAGRSVRITTDHSALEAPSLATIQRDDKRRLVFHIDFVRMRRTDSGHRVAPKGTGSRLFAAQLQTAKRLGFNRIELNAAGGTDFWGTRYVGHLVWPKYGFDGTIEPLLSQASDPAPRSVRQTETVQELLALGNVGRRWYTKQFYDEARPLPMEFSLRPGSPSLRHWNAYARERGLPTVSLR
jgi:hypothetical protein